MAQVKKPNRKGTPPKGNTSNNLDKNASSGLVDLGFKVDPEFKRQFKIEATLMDMTMVDYLKLIRQFYIKNNG